MRPVSWKMLNNTTTISPFESVSQDPSAGKIYQFAAEGPPIACSVQPKRGLRTDEFGRENMVVYYEIIYAQNPHVRSRDQINWTDENKTVWCEVVIEPCGLRNVWVVTAVERQI